MGCAMNCNQCAMLSINGIACHEDGCPNETARWDVDSAQFVRQRECRECGYMRDANVGCSCFDDDMTED